MGEVVLDKTTINDDEPKYESFGRFKYVTRKDGLFEIILDDESNKFTDRDLMDFIYDKVNFPFSDNFDPHAYQVSNLVLITDIREKGSEDRYAFQVLKFNAEVAKRGVPIDSKDGKPKAKASGYHNVLPHMISNIDKIPSGYLPVVLAVDESALNGQLPSFHGVGALALGNTAAQDAKLIAAGGFKSVYDAVKNRLTLRRFRANESMTKEQQSIGQMLIKLIFQSGTALALPVDISDVINLGALTKYLPGKRVLTYKNYNYNLEPGSTGFYTMFGTLRVIARDKAPIQIEEIDDEDEA